MCRRNFLVKAALAALLLAGNLVFGECTYDSDKNIIRVSNFPAANPLLLKRLDFIDNTSNWNIIDYDQKTDTYTINAHLWIGNNDGTETYVQIGTAQALKEQLIIKGDLVICPYYIKGENKEKSAKQVKRCVNRLTIGDPKNKKITPTLKIYSKYPDEQHSIYLGRVPRLDGGKGRRRFSTGYGGELLVYNSNITAAQPGNACRIAQPSLRGTKIVFEDSMLSGFHQAIMAGLPGHNCVVKNTVLKDSGSGFTGCPIPLTAEGCSLENLGCAINSQGHSLNIELKDCIFQDNQYNWRITRGKIKMVDCKFGKPVKGDIVRTTVLKKGGKEIVFTPEVISRRHAVFLVEDVRRLPIQGAIVQIKSGQNAKDAVSPVKVISGPKGLTPGKDKKNSILMTEFKLKATDDPKKPALTNYTYEVTFTAPGYKTKVLKNFQPPLDGKPKEIILQQNPK